MKRIISITLVFLFIFCGCGNDKPTEAEYTYVGEFSYHDDYSSYSADMPGVITSGFVNTNQTKIKNTEAAVEHAKNECTAQYDSISVSYDSTTNTYKVCFFKKDTLGGDQTVYMDKNGITQLIIYGE